MNQIKLKIILAIAILFYGIKSFSQTTTTILYDASSDLSTTKCNVFDPPVNVGGKLHTGVIGGATFSTADGLDLPTKYILSTDQTKRTDYRISYPFKNGYTYSIEITAFGDASNYTAYPSLGASLFTAAGLTYTSTSCGPGDISGFPQLGSLFKTQVNGTPTVYSPSGANFTSPNNFDYLVLEATCFAAQDITANLYIQKIKITETPPVSFTLPTSTTFGCGTTTPQAFTVTNVYGTTGITNYTWNLGATPNGWKLPNGSAAPATYSTGTVNTLTLTPVCGSAQKNISATVTANGNNYNTNTSTVSITQPTLSINGASSFCSGSSNYSINNLPCNASVAWSISPATGIGSLSCSSCTSTSLSRVSDGTVTLTAVASNLCGGANVTLQEDIKIGTSPLTGIYSTATNTLSLQTVNFVPVGNIYAQYQWPGVSNITATLTSGSPPGTGFYSFPGHFSFNISSGQQVSVYLSGTSACGSVDATRTFIQSSYYYLVVSPNPATNNINVGITEVADTTGKIAKEQKLISSNTSGITKMYLYDFNTGILVKQWNFREMKTSNYDLNISGVKSGVYLLKMERNNKSTSTKIIIK